MTDSFRIQIQSSNINLVSDGPYLDILEIEVIEDLSYETNNFQLILEKGTIAQKEIPP